MLIVAGILLPQPMIHSYQSMKGLYPFVPLVIIVVLLRCKTHCQSFRFIVAAWFSIMGIGNTNYSLDIAGYHWLFPMRIIVYISFKNQEIQHEVTFTLRWAIHVVRMFHSFSANFDTHPRLLMRHHRWSQRPRFPNKHTKPYSFYARKHFAPTNLSSLVNPFLTHHPLVTTCTIW